MSEFLEPLCRTDWSTPFFVADSSSSVWFITINFIKSVSVVLQTSLGVKEIIALGMIDLKQLGLLISSSKKIPNHLGQLW